MLTNEGRFRPGGWYDWRRRMQLLGRVHSPLASLAPVLWGRNLIERCSPLITRQLNTEKTSAGERFVRKLSTSGFLRSFHPRLPYLSAQMDYQVELNEIKVDYTVGNAVSSLETCLKIQSLAIFLSLSLSLSVAIFSLFLFAVGIKFGSKKMVDVCARLRWILVWLSHWRGIRWIILIHQPLI